MYRKSSGLFPCLEMSGERYVVKSSSGMAAIGSKFTLTIAATSADDETRGKTDENENQRVKISEKASELKRQDEGATESTPEVDQKFFSLFKAVAGDDLEVDAFELQGVIGNIFKRDFGMVKEFSIECCRSLIVMADMDRSGKLNFGQFKSLFQWILDMRKVYKMYENSQSWDMDSRDLKQVIRHLNCDLRQETIDLIAMKYRNRQLRIDFDDYLQICARIWACHDSYDSYQIAGDSFDEYIMHIIYT